MEKCWTFPDCISAPNSGEALDIMKNDCKVAFSSLEVLKGEKYSQGTTYWFPCNQAPRCTFERLALDLFQHHTRDIPSYNPSLSGVEWWVLYLHNIDDVGFHWDRDYGLELENNQLVHPYLGTVTYLTSIGGPTVFLDMNGETKSEEYHGYQFSRYRVSYPKPGKHVTFNGNLLHGAPSLLLSSQETNSETNSEEEEQDDEDQEGSDDESIPEDEARITFLANIWIDHQPTHAEPLSEELLSSLSNDSSIRMVFHQTDPVPLDITGGSHSKWTLSANDQRYQIKIPLPSEEKLNKLTASPGQTFEVVFPRGDGVLLAEDDNSDGTSSDSEQQQDEEDSSGEEVEEVCEVKQENAKKRSLGEAKEENRRKRNL